MRQIVTIFATMQDGIVLVERTGDFGRFVAIVLGFRRDPDCIRLAWRVETASPPPPPTVPAAGHPALAFVPAC